MDRLTTTFCRHDEIPFAMAVHPSWKASPVGVIRRELRAGLRGLLHVPNDPSSSAEVERIMRFLEPALKRFDAVQLLETTSAEWVLLLTNENVQAEGLDRIHAKIMSKHLKRLMGLPIASQHPAPTSAEVETALPAQTTLEVAHAPTLHI